MSLTGNVVNARLTNYRRGFPIEIPIEISIDHWYRIYYCMYLSNLMNSARPTWSRCCSTHTRHACTYTRHRRDYTRVYNIYIHVYVAPPCDPVFISTIQSSHNTIIKGWTVGGSEPPCRCIVAHDPLIRWPYWTCNIARVSCHS